MRHFQISNGEAPPSGPVPDQSHAEVVPPAFAAILGDDMPWLRPRFAVEEGQRVTIGQPLFSDRKHPELAYVSPLSGIVAEASYGPRRTLSICAVRADHSGGIDTAPSPVPADDPASARKALQSRGLWPAFRARPFGRTPAPDAAPRCIVVNAVRSVPQAPDPAVVLAGREDAFAFGLSVLAGLTEGSVYLCQSPGKPLPGPDHGRIVHVSFSGSVASGLEGTQIDRLCPIVGDTEVWSIGYQDVIAIGHLFQSGTYLADRVVSVTGPDVPRTRIVRTCLGVRLADLGATVGHRALSGGREAAYLGRFDTLVTLRTARRQKSRSQLGALIPTRALGRALAVDIPVVPLLRALSIGDAETAERLGCLALTEEDMAAASRQCTSGRDYGALLRQVLDKLLADAA